MSRRLEGKVAAVTGASKGIGASIAKHLADEGAAVVVNYASSKQGADRVVAEIKDQGSKAVAVQADMSKHADIKRLFAEVNKAFGRLDVETEGVLAAGAHPIHRGDVRKQIEAQTPLGRIGQPQDIGPAAVFLASDDSRWITGETLYIAGGFR
jgi:NAD(P)-dependent dehydrogenase (short-subunit alcohol dehydrogenase family)